jgi:CO/xanthine dehydrogenase Mo-binding subunit
MSATRNRGVSRRGFIGGTGALVVSVMAPRFLSPAVAGAARARERPFRPPEEGPDVFAVDSWVEVRGDGRITIFTGKAELGTGTATATLQIAADELDVGMSMLDLVEPDTSRTVDQMYTAGSQTTKSQWAEGGLRLAAAEARAVLMELASDHLGAPVADLVVTNGVVSVRDRDGDSVSYAELIGDRRFDRRVSPSVQTKSPADYDKIGFSVRRVDIPDKVTGRFVFTQDVELPGMLHARIVRPPVVDARLVRVDTSVKPYPGVVKIVVKGDRIGVVAHTEQQAIDAARALRPQWDIPPMPDPRTLYQDISSATPDTRRVLVETLVDEGGVEQAIRGAPRKVSARYEYPYQLHGTLGASCAVADVQSDRVTVWSPTQGVYPLRDAIATALEMRPEQVRVIYTEGSGCYGLNAADSVSIDAAIMSQGVGAPVRMQYMRGDDHTGENYGTAMVMEATAGLDGDRIVGWDNVSYTASRGSRPGPPGNVVAGGAMGFDADPNPPSPPPEPPLGPDSSNAVTSYDLPHNRVVVYTVPSRFYTGPLRSPARIQNTFANESFMDELASAANADPVAFRLRHVRDPRLADVIRTSAEMAGWQPRPSNGGQHRDGSLLRGRGFAAMQYEGTEAYAGVVVDL